MGQKGSFRTFTAFKTRTMKTRIILYSALWLATACGTGMARIERGMTKSEVEDIVGSPTEKEEYGSVTHWRYGEKLIVFVDGKVIGPPSDVNESDPSAALSTDSIAPVE